MKKLIFAFILMAMTVGFGASSVSAQEMKDDKMMKSGNPMVGGAAMYKNKNIVENAINSKDHTTLVAAVKVAGLVETLQGKGPFTVFAPTNSAFDMLPAGTVRFDFRQKSISTPDERRNKTSQFDSGRISL